MHNTALAFLVMQMVVQATLWAKNSKQFEYLELNTRPFKNMTVNYLYMYSCKYLEQCNVMYS